MPGDRGRFLLKPAMISSRSSLRSSRGFSVIMQPAAVERHVGAVDADERGEAIDVLVLQNRAGQRLLALGHRGEGDVCGASVKP